LGLSIGRNVELLVMMRYRLQIPDYFSASLNIAE